MKWFICIALFSVISVARAGVVTSESADIIIGTTGGLKVYTQDKRYQFKIGGRMQLDYNQGDAVFNSARGGDDASDLFFRRTRLYFSGVVEHHWKYALQYNLREGSNGGDLIDAYIQYTGFKPLSLRFGNQKTFPGLEQQISSKHITTIERAVTTTAFVPGHQLGVSARWARPNYSLATGIFESDQGEQGETDWNWISRGTYAWRPNQVALLHTGLSYQRLDGSDVGPSDQRFELRDNRGSNDGRVRIDVGALNDNASGADILGLELAARYGRLSLQAEYYDANYDDTDTGDQEADGYYILGSYFLTPDMRPYTSDTAAFGAIRPSQAHGAWELLARFSEADFRDADGNQVESLTLGINWYANRFIRISANYIHSELSDPVAVSDSQGNATGELVDDGDAIATRLQIAF